MRELVLVEELFHLRDNEVPSDSLARKPTNRHHMLKAIGLAI
jgi:hypothetical protein